MNTPSIAIVSFPSQQIWNDCNDPRQLFRHGKMGQFSECMNELIKSDKAAAGLRNLIPLSVGMNGLRFGFSRNSFVARICI